MATVSLEDAYAAPKPDDPSGRGGGTVSYEDAIGPPETWSEYLSGMAGAVSRGVLPFGAAEELKGVVQGGLAKLRGGDYQQAHDNAVADAKAEAKQIHERHPWQSGAAEGYGGAGLGLGAGAALSAARGAPLVGRAL